MDEDTVVIKPAGDKGRGLFAAKHFKAGETILEEEPLVSCQFAWNELYKYAACEYCLRALETAEENVRRLTFNKEASLPYPELCSVDKTKHISCEQCLMQYCSVECKDAAWAKYHRTLCRRSIAKEKSHALDVLAEKWRKIHPPPETATIMLCCKMVATVQQSLNPESTFHTFTQFSGHSVEGCDVEWLGPLLGVKDMNLFQSLCQAFFSAMNMEGCQQWATAEGFNSMMSVVAMNAQGIGTSSLSTWVKNVEQKEMPDRERFAVDEYINDIYNVFDTTVGEFLDNEGSGLYGLQSHCNHSCVPNAEVSFPFGNHRLALKAKVDIQPGEEISISYLGCDLERSRHSRQKILNSNYRFVCSCPKCEAEIDKPDVTSEEEEEDED